jgi:hypothetical protein
MIRIDDLAEEIADAVREYTEDVSDAIMQEVDTTSKAVLKDIERNSPKRTGEYAKGWKRTKRTSGGKVRYVIHNKKKGRIAHLLEFGHAKRGGGRVAGKPHVRPSYDKEVPGMEQRIKAIIRNGG